VNVWTYIDVILRNTVCSEYELEFMAIILCTRIRLGLTGDKPAPANDVKIDNDKY